MRSIKKLLVCLAFATAAGFAFAQPSPNDPAPGPAPVHQRQGGQTLKSLGLTDAQVTQVQAIVDKARAAQQTKSAEIRVIRAQIDLAMTSSIPDLKAVDVLVDKQVALQGEREKTLLAAEAEVHSLVGDNVFAQLKRWWMGQGPRKAPRD